MCGVCACMPVCKHMQLKYVVVILTHGLFACMFSEKVRVHREGGSEGGRGDELADVSGHLAGDLLHQIGDWSQFQPGKRAHTHTG